MKFDLSTLKKYAAHPFALILLIVMAPLPFIYLVCSFYMKMQHLDYIESDLGRLAKKSAELKLQKDKESAFFASLEQADHYFLDKHIETLIFLEPEMIKLQALPYNIKQNEAIKSRLTFLKDGANRLKFTEDNIRKSDLFQEMEEKQQRPIELDEEDLKKLLVFIEGVPIWPYALKDKRPQLIITDFDLGRRALGTQENVYTLNLHLLKRESSKGDLK